MKCKEVGSECQSFKITMSQCNNHRIFLTVFSGLGVEPSLNRGQITLENGVRD